MERTRRLLLAILASAVVFSFFSVLYLVSLREGGTSASGMMKGMMGGGSNSFTGAMSSYAWVVPFLLVAAAVGMTGVGYVLLVARDEPDQDAPEMSPGTAVVQTDARQGWAVILQTSKPEERKVLDILAAHGGRYLQKFIVKESGLTKLKTHRVISRLAERGVVVATKSGNTNEVALAKWLCAEEISA